MSFNWKIAGQAGEGVMVSAKLMALAAKKHGLQAFNYLEYPSLIKGGHQTGQVYADNENASCQKRELDLLIAFNEEGVSLHKSEIKEKTLVVRDGEQVSKLDSELVLPIFKIAQEVAGSRIAANIVALGLSAYLLGLDKEIFKEIIAQEFENKGQEIIDKNLKAFAAGFEKAKDFSKPIKDIKKSQDNSILLTGNEAVGMGAIAAGLQYYSTYPMTPASALLHYLAEQQENYPLVVKHTEDEIAGINQAIGASFAGVRAMTGSAGGGFALMVEGLSLAGVTELPLVVLEAQRPGPATGLPTWTSQADLQFVLRAGHGEFPKVLLTPGDAKEHFELTKLAFELAEKYQILALILSDKHALESYMTMQKPATSHQVGEASKRQFFANSYEHDDKGFATEDAEITKKQVDKRLAKEKEILKDLPKPYIIGNEAVKFTFVGWGSTLLTMQELVKQTKEINYLHFPTLWPFNTQAFLDLAKNKNLVAIEGNATGQMQQLIRQETGVEIKKHIRRYDGRPFYVEDILDWLKKQ
jgi:2-oxoglutarate/2-oxoacid ferredoxin oxidoreductase subunit alpha